MKQNLLDEWRDYFLSLKWKLGLQNDVLFLKIDDIYNNIRDFFSIEDYTNKLGEINEPNFIKSLLAGRHRGSLSYLREISRILDFYREIKHTNNYNLINSYGKVNFSEFRDRFFEIYINMLLYEQGIKSDLNASYLDKNKRLRPLDSHFRFNEKDYIIECKKIYNEKGEVFWDLGYRIIVYTRKFTKDIEASELFSGFIVFKNDTKFRSLKNRAIVKYNELLKKYFMEFRNNSSSTLKIAQKYEDDDIIIEIRPSYTFDELTVKEELEGKFKDYLIFSMTAKNVISGSANLTISNRINYQNPNELLFKKINDKIKQHSDLNCHKIYVFEIESLDIFDYTRFPIPIKKENLDWKKLNKLMHRDLSILIIIKTMTSGHLISDSGLLTPSHFDNELLQVLTSLNYIIN